MKITARAGRSGAGFIPLGLLVVMVWFVAAGGPANAENTTTPHVHNAAEPPGGLRTLPAVEIWRRGGEEDEVLFGAVTRIITDDEGTLYVLDSQLSQVLLFSPTGDHLRTIMREGDGPGEMRYPADIFFLPDGRLGAIQSFPGKVITVQPDGTPAGSFVFGGSEGNFGVLLRGLSCGSRIVLGGIDITYDNDGSSVQAYFLASCENDGAEIKRYYERQVTRTYSEAGLSELELDAPWERVALAADGRCIIAPERNA